MHACLPETYILWGAHCFRSDLGFAWLVCCFPRQEKKKEEESLNGTDSPKEKEKKEKKKKVIACLAWHGFA